MSGKRTNKKKAEKTSGISGKTDLLSESEHLMSVKMLQQELESKVSWLTESNRQLKRKIFDLYTIFEISRNFNAVLDFQTLLDTFILTSLAQVGASKGAIFLEDDGETNRYVMVKKRGSGPFPKEDNDFKTHSELTNYLTKLNRPVVTSEIIDDIVSENERKILKVFHPGLIVPLIYQSDLSGVLILTDKISGRDFTMDDIEFLSILGSQISVAIENSRLYEAEKKATEQLRAAQQQLVNSERLAALGEMSAKVAHEINNPLGIIKNYILLLKRSVDENNEARNYAGIVRQEIDRIARIVKELLEFYRPQSLSFEKINVGEVLDDVLVLMSRQFEKYSIEVHKNITVDSPVIKGSPENLKQVFINIIINACDVMSGGGSLNILVGKEGNNLTIKFCDNGPGISPEVIPRIFEPFFTTKDPGKGTGLGLSVCYGIMKQHNGTIKYYNIAPGGCFEITLPYTEGNDNNE